MLVCRFDDEGRDFSIYEWDFANGAFSQSSRKMIYQGTVATKCITRNFHGESFLGIVLLASDENVQILLYLSDGKGDHRKQVMAKAHLPWGYIGLELAKMNGHGHRDILTDNRDNIDSDPYNSPKCFHGVSVHTNDWPVPFS